MYTFFNHWSSFSNMLCFLWFSRCTAHCNSGYEFDNGESTIQKDCDPMTGQFFYGPAFPKCIRKSFTCFMLFWWFKIKKKVFCAMSKNGILTTNMYSIKQYSCCIVFIRVVFSCRILHVFSDKVLTVLG